MQKIYRKCLCCHLEFNLNNAEVPYLDSVAFYGNSTVVYCIINYYNFLLLLGLLTKAVIQIMYPKSMFEINSYLSYNS